MPFRPPLVPPVIGLILGTGIGYVDSRPTWDDTGITVGAVFVSAAMLATIWPRSGWLAGLAVGLPVLAFDVALHGNYGAAAAVVLALAGAGAGILVSKALSFGAGKRAPSRPPNGT
jgi:hypothetical protein